MECDWEGEGMVCTREGRRGSGWGLCVGRVVCVL